MALAKTTEIAQTMGIASLVIALKGLSEIRVKVTFRNSFNIKKIYIVVANKAEVVETRKSIYRNVQTYF